MTTHTLSLSDTHWESAWGPLLKYRSHCLPNTAFHSCENLLIKENESMKWAQLSHFAELDGMQLGLVKITLSQWLKNTPTDEITCRLANHYSMKLLHATVKTYN